MRSSQTWRRISSRALLRGTFAPAAEPRRAVAAALNRTHRTFSAQAGDDKISSSSSSLSSVAAVALALGGGFYFLGKVKPAASIQCRESNVRRPVVGGDPVDPEIANRKWSFEEFKQVAEQDDRIIVAYDNKVYDVSDFTGHPGGVGRLEMASGHDLAVFWETYTQHNRSHVVDDILSVYQVGVFENKEDYAKVTAATKYDPTVYNSDQRYPTLITNTEAPYNAEAPMRRLMENFHTPAGLHFVRNHSHVPTIDPEDYTLTAKVVGIGEKEYTLEELKTKFKQHSVSTVIQCNGNRREDYHKIPETPGGEQPAFGPPHWVGGAIGCAQWSGPRLRDVLADVGMDVNGIALRETEADPRWLNVGLLGYDQDEVGNQYCCNFPFDKAVDPFGDVILATHMNGEEIPRAYGYPVRCIVPGHAGARNCKYLQHVEVTNKPCLGQGNWKQYAVHAPDVTTRKIMEFEKYKPELMRDPPVQEMPVQSMIVSHGAGDLLGTVVGGLGAGNGELKTSVTVRGIAWGGGGSAVNRVDVSIDGGETWTRAELLPRPIQQRRRSEWAWQFFEKEVQLPAEMVAKLKQGQDVPLTLTSKALNGAWNVQPASPKGNVNAHGCCVNHWYKVPVKLCAKAKFDVKMPQGEYPNKPSGGEFMAPFRNFDPPRVSASS